MKPFLLFSVLLCCACNNTPAPSKTIADTTPAAAKSDAPATPLRDTLPADTARQPGLVTLQPGADSVALTGELTEKDRSRTFTINVPAGKNLYAEVTPVVAKNANVRINQLLMPDGSADGPFGRSLKYPLQQKGRYSVIVGQNLMAGDGKWAGKFILKLRVE
ncbi:hypothetical protein [Deminuibacter soli]|uniref:YtkA-like domain-containing protein n=1 Tax=Deminuibacter soli TaxID=2291815 RepID=A0A3E1NIF6_9BACT|nr:hypothetical protein [Deminuibacter soli]RFM27604.1 hypothetical protein DXN05_12865 [Deminuibacter soli]